MTRIGYIVGSLSSRSINRHLAHALAALAPEGVEMVELDYSDLPIYSPDMDADYPPVAREWKAAVESVDGVVIITPEYLRSIPGALKNALDIASRPWGTNSFAGRPVSIVGASPGNIGTAAAQQHLRGILAHLGAPTLTQPEVFLRFDPASFDETGAVVDEALEALLRQFLDATVDHVQRHTAQAAVA